MASVFQPNGKNIHKTVRSGSAVIAASQLVRILVQVLSVGVLSRLIAPSDFGMMAMCSPIFAFASLFLDLGFSSITIQKQNLDHDVVNFLFWINIAVSAAAAICLVITAPLIAWFYGQPETAGLLMAMAVPLLISGSTSQHLALIARRMQFGLIALIEGLVACASFGVAFIWALVAPSYWALFGSVLAGALVPAIFGWSLSRWRPTFPSKHAETRSLLRFGAGLSGYSLTEFFARNIDNILIAKRWGEVELGLYDRAYRLLLFPLSQVVGPIARVMIPALSRTQSDHETYKSLYLRMMVLLAYGLIPGISFSIIYANELIPLALGHQWIGSVPIFRALGFASLLQILNNSFSWLYVSQGRSREYFVYGVFSASVAVTAIVVGLPFGPVGVATAYAISEYVRTIFVWWHVGRKGPVRLIDIIKFALPSVIGSHLAILILDVGVKSVSFQGPSNDILRLGLGLVLCYGLFCLVAFMFPGQFRLLKEAVGGFLHSRRGVP